MISVLMSVYNSEKTIEVAIKSILSQTFKDFELLIVDDSSKDSTYKLLNKIKDTDKRIKIFKNESNIGLTKSLNFLANKAKYDIYARHDSDDYSEPSRFQKQLIFLEGKNYDACTTRARIIINNNKIPGLSFYLPKRLVMNFKNPFIHGTLMIKKEAFEICGKYDERFYYAQDYKLFKDLISKGKNIKTINEVLYNLNTNENISTKYIKEQKYFFECAKKNISPDLNNFL